MRLLQMHRCRQHSTSSQRNPQPYVSALCAILASLTVCILPSFPIRFSPAVHRPFPARACASFSSSPTCDMLPSPHVFHHDMWRVAKVHTCHMPCSLRGL